MNKRELIAAIQSRRCRGLPLAEIQVVVDDMLNVIAEAVRKGHDVKLANFGVFTSVKLKARVGRNPNTGKPIKLPSRKAFRFKATPLLRHW